MSFLVLHLLSTSFDECQAIRGCYLLHRGLIIMYCKFATAVNLLLSVLAVVNQLRVFLARRYRSLVAISVKSNYFVAFFGFV